MALDLPHPDLAAGGEQLEGIPDANPARPERPGRHRAESRHRETAVYRQPGRGVRLPIDDLGERAVHRLDEVGDPVPRAGGHRNDRRSFEECPRAQRRDIVPHQGEPLRVGREIHLIHDDQAAPHLEKAEDVEVLPGLGHHPLVGGDDQQNEVDPRRAGEHVLDQPLVPRDVDDAHTPPAGEIQVGKAEVDRHAPSFLLFEPVGVDAGEGFDERAFPVIDVAGGSDDGVAHPRGAQGGDGAGRRHHRRSRRPAAADVSGGGEERTGLIPSRTVRGGPTGPPKEGPPVTVLSLILHFRFDCAQRTSGMRRMPLWMRVCAR
jgi:hypothetical protein